MGGVAWARRGVSHAHALGAAMLIIASGCPGAEQGGETGVAGGEAVVRDSMGIRVVESSGPLWTKESAWSVGPERVRIGALDGAFHEVFGRVGVVRLLSDGRFVVSDLQAREIRLFDAAGGFLARTGRGGSGPGEFESINWLGTTASDTILVYDAVLQRLSVFGPEGRFVRSHSASLMVRAVLPDGRLLTQFPGSYPFTLPAPGSLVTDTARVWVFDPVTDRRDLVVTAPMFDALFLVDESGRPHLPQVPFSGAFGATQHAGRVYSVDRAGRRVRVHEGSNWHLSEEWRDLRPLEPVTAEMLDLVRRSPEVFFRWVPEPDRVLRQMRLPTHMPAFYDVVADAEGNAWAFIYHYPPGLTDPLSTVFAHDGVVLGEVALPRGFRVTQIGADFVLGVDVDSLGVNYVVLYGLSKGDRQ